MRDHSPDVVGFVKTRISKHVADRVIAQLKIPNSFRVEADGFSGGIWICWYDHIQIDVLFNHFQFVQCRIHCKSNNHSALATFVYASPNPAKRKTLWSYLQLLSNHINEPWVILGYFNAALSPNDRKGCVSIPVSDQDFSNIVFDSSLHNLGYQGPDFTWYRGPCAVRLDRCLCNDKWLDAYPDTLVYHLLRMKSDHRPLLLSIGKNSNKRHQSQFRYFVGWTLHKDFHKLVLDNWDSSLLITQAISKFSSAAKIWNQHSFGQLSHRKRNIMGRLRGIQRYLDKKHSAYLLQLETKLQAELELILDQEELL
ncbi:uncharacterized protein LOC120145366 [Hibiscus syriacus]|uniref:uncharacterized protein LOC120145366 n=1 Tax=Hibiscus syriacus TaxID=106335 RepID=UPI00192149E4|nr:uncharacterized protein LOC120145366 [Hibiscus syriacus]